MQATPFQMALIAAGVANLQGMVMRPKIEIDAPATAMSQAMTAETAGRVRQLFAAVVQRGTASGPGFGGLLKQNGVTAGGKTGTAQREQVVIDPATEKPVMIRDAQGRQRIKKEFRIDSCFIGFAPLDKPQVAFAVVVEGGGYGAKTAAPIAAKLVLKAKGLGLLQEVRAGNATAKEGGTAK